MLGLAPSRDAGKSLTFKPKAFISAPTPIKSTAAMAAITVNKPRPNVPAQAGVDPQIRAGAK